MTSRLSSIVPVWIVAVIGAVLVGTIAQPSSIYRWLSVDLVVGRLRDLRHPARVANQGWPSFCAWRQASVAP
ncbi:MAG: hypothetical protein WDM88_02935 [Galbitalea sp.]